MAKPVKPLGGKAYGSIPHLPGSRLGPSDHHCHAGQETICWTKARDKHDRIIVTEKLDGSCVAVARIGDEIVAITRAGYKAEDSPHELHHLFGSWVDENSFVFSGALAPGERLVGEWLAMAHGTRYAIDAHPFVAFDLMDRAGRLPHGEMVARVNGVGLTHARVIHDGAPAHLDAILPALKTSGHGALDPVEGAVWRVEREGRFDFIAKWVRPDKIDGYLLPSVSGGNPVWNWRPSC